MKIPEEAIAHVVTEASQKMDDAKYASDKVDRLIATQPQVGQYVLAYENELSLDGVVSVLFHAALILDSLVHATGRHPRVITYQDLDEAAQRVDTLDALAGQEPEVASFIAGNVTMEGDEGKSAIAQKVLAQVAAALVA